MPGRGSLLVAPGGLAGLVAAATASLGGGSVGLGCRSGRPRCDRTDPVPAQGEGFGPGPVGREAEGASAGEPGGEGVAAVSHRGDLGACEALLVA